ncbi:MAG TPA: adenylate/guanylate cyclase domain-containing protein [Chitinophagaceae bacterium]|nr:adenylate/guanylate cyclase domain-containing protein [Chitinophagaceae bacterium]
MDQVSLKQVLRRKNELLPLFGDLERRLGSRIRIEDGAGKILWSCGVPGEDYRLPVEFDGNQLGWVIGDETVRIWANLLTLLLKEEDKRIKLGREVLNLYREINLVFDFSDKVAKIIDAREISHMALEEAAHVIPFQYGGVILWDESTRSLRLEAFSGNSFFAQDTLDGEFHLLHEIILNGQSDILNDLSTLKKAGLIPTEVHSLMYSALKVKHRVMGAFILGSLKEECYTAVSLKLLTTIALQSSSAIESSLLFEKNIRESRESEEAMRRILDVAAKFVPGQFIRSLGHGAITDVRLGDQAEKLVTVLFTDIRDYTSLSELMTPEETFSFICSLNERMGPIIRDHEGFINQYLGDSIMAIFPGNPSDALSAAIVIQREIHEFNQERHQQNLVPIRIGIGMHCGPLIMGITGDQERMDACTISDTVNTASRVESLTKHYQAEILLSQACLNEMEHPERFRLRDLGMVQLKGKLKSIHIFECIDSNSPSRIESMKQTLPFFNEGVIHFGKKSFEISRDSFKKVMEIDPEDAVSQFLYHHTNRILNSGSQEHITGIVEMEEK